MEQEQRFIFGSAYAVFFGPASQNGFHKNAAFQIILSEESDITVTDEAGNEYVGGIVLIKPLVRNKVQCDGQVTHMYLSPRINVTLDLIELVGESNVHILNSAKRLPFQVGASRREVVDTLDDMDQISMKRLDPRLLSVLEDLNQNLDNPSILDAAKRSGLSRSRVRTLAREQMGMPLSTWVTWRKLVKANKALSTGANLSEAALAGNFADQAHFTRTMKRMLGGTPSEALEVYT